MVQAMSWWKCSLLIVTAAILMVVVGGQFNEPPGKRREQTFKVLEFENSNINQRYPGTLRYYCTFRGKWSAERHPNDFPRRPSWGPPIIVSHSNGYRMWTGTEAVTAGVESIAEDGFFTIYTNEFLNAGFETLHMVHGERMFNTTESQHLPPINVTFEHPFLSSMVKIQPSPDWFVGFSDFRTISYETETYYNRILIQSYVWDSGTDGGQTYTALDRDLDPQIPCYRFCARGSGKSNHQCPDLTKGRIETPPLGQFLDYTGTYIPTPGEFECVLRVGEGDVFAGTPFNETQIRPPLSVPRPDDDFVDGVSPHDPEFEQKTGQSNPRASTGVRLTILAAVQAITVLGFVVAACGIL
ncbi:hypothetical protein IV203_007509 [Nitzschia inconspicua]|uniref:Spondin domain-containing protein n=1 Tax=Nitzschia inconspicua TaxID=303405 RepID=A0A9K3PD90_9STRA|nr:hypothetical protein IV203_007509 [Nitzschia inconspicua]